MSTIVDIVESISDAQQNLGNFGYDLAVVDRMLSDGDALDIVTALSRLSERLAIIMLMAKDAKEDVIECLNSGADDCLGKPFEPLEFIATVRAVLRRPTGLLSLISEAMILEALPMRRGRIITRGALIETIYGFDDDIESNTLEAQVFRLRKKLAELGGDVEIRSVRGIGYILRMARI